MKKSDYSKVEEVQNLGSCIFCENLVTEKSVEHIVPESLGNKSYVLPSGTICRACNNNFSKFEDKALTRTMLGFERARMGIPTKKGNPATAKSGEIIFRGSRNFRKNIVTTSGISEEHIKDFDEKDGSYKITISDFDKSEMAMSKLLLKIGYESLFKSQRAIYNNYNFKDLKEHLTNKNTKDWPFLSTTALKLSTFKSIPTFSDKHELNKIKCRLLISELDKNMLFFSFEYSVVSYLINLVERNCLWTQQYLEKDKWIKLYPEHLKKKFG